MTSSPQSGVRGSHAGVWLSLLVLLAAVASALVAGGARSATHATGLIAFARHDGIYVMRGDGTGVRALRSGGVASDAFGLAWSPDGRTLAFTTKQAALWTMRADGTHLVRVVGVKDSVLRSLGEPTWLPRRRTIAFVATRDDQQGADVWLVNADGSKLRRLARTSGWEYDVEWSPLGGQIAVTDMWDFLCHLRVLNTDGSNFRILNPGRRYEAAFPSWSPVGHAIAFTRWSRSPSGGSGDTRSAEIWVTDAALRSQVRLTRNKLKDGYPAWSPDGRRIAFVREDGAGPFGTYPDASGEIYTMNADGSGISRLTHNRVAEWSPAWQSAFAP